jgi:hypothetical protein
MLHPGVGAAYTDKPAKSAHGGFLHQKFDFCQKSNFFGSSFYQKLGFSAKPNFLCTIAGQPISWKSAARLNLCDLAFVSGDDAKRFVATIGKR